MKTSFEERETWANKKSANNNNNKQVNRKEINKSILDICVIVIFAFVAFYFAFSQINEIKQLRAESNQASSQVTKALEEQKSLTKDLNKRLDNIDSGMNDLQSQITTNKEESDKNFKNFNSSLKAYGTALHTDNMGFYTPNPAPQKIYSNVKLSAELQIYAAKLCKEKNVNFNVFLSLMSVENRNFNPTLISKTNDYGLCQINKNNHKRLSKMLGITNFLDPKQSILAGVTMLSEAYNAAPSHNSSLALMVYNMGYGGAHKRWSDGIYSTKYSRAILNTVSKL